MRLALLLLALLLLFACAGKGGPAHRAEARHSSGSVPCDSTEIEVSNSNYGSPEWKRGSWTWTAKCRGRSYFCASHLPGGAMGRNQYWSAAQCTER